MWLEQILEVNIHTGQCRIVFRDHDGTIYNNVPFLNNYPLKALNTDGHIIGFITTNDIQEKRKSHFPDITKAQGDEGEAIQGITIQPREEETD